MEVFAGFVEHVNAQAGKVIEALERLGIRDNTLVIYIGQRLRRRGPAGEHRRAVAAHLLDHVFPPGARADNARRPLLGRDAV
jgi:hypothetical protein